MRTLSCLLTLCVVLLVPTVARSGSIDREVFEALRSAPVVPVIVLLEHPAADQKTGESIARRQEQVLENIRGSLVLTQRWMTLAGFAGEADAEAIGSLAADSQVLRVGIDPGGRGGLAQSIPLVGAQVVHAAGHNGRGITVAVLDSGVATHHPDIRDGLVDQHCFCRNSNGSGCCPNGMTEQSGDGAAEDDNGHGTNVSGIIVSRGVVTHVGLAPAANLVVVKVLDATNSFNSTSQIISGLDWIAAQHPEVKVINMSLGTDARFPAECDNSTTFTTAFATVINSLRSRGTMVFVSSGNDHSPIDIEAPACIRNAIAVGAVYDSDVGSVSFEGCTDAVTAVDQIACFSNSSPAVDLLAPGAYITSTGRGATSSTYLGTSQASPHAAGTAALLMEISPSLRPDQIEDALKLTGRNLTDARNGLTRPRLNAQAAAAGLIQPPGGRRRAVRH